MGHLAQKRGIGLTKKQTKKILYKYLAVRT